MRCAEPKCRRRIWAAYPFCFMHLAEHARRSLPPDQWECLRERIAAVFGTLTYRERETLNLRCGIVDGYVYSTEEVRRIFKVSTSTARRVEARALRKLTHPVRLRKLAEFFDRASSAS